MRANKPGVCPHEKAFVVTSGEYSDFRIVAVFLDEKAAGDFVAKHNALGEYDDCTVIEYDIATERTFSGDIWVGHWKMNGPDNYYAYREEEWFRKSWHMGTDPGPASVVKARVDSYGGLWVEVQGTSKDHVEKSLHDRAAQLKAEHAGIA